jgi:hypothetical protein
MPRTSTASRGGFIDHVLNRGDSRSDVFPKDDDCAAFVNFAFKQIFGSPKNNSAALIGLLNAIL